MRVLFWNTHQNNNINTVLSELIVENDISIVVLAEYVADINDLLSILNSQSISMTQCNSLCERITLLGAIEDIELKRDSTHYTIQVVNGKDILCCVHLNSKLYTDSSYREIQVDQIVRDIEEVERELKTKNSIIVGDFNMNPYESVLIDARYFHGIPICSEANRGTRKVAGKEFQMFYNPMWNFLGDFAEPYGTYYYNNGNTENTYWNIFDQVIIRPDLKDRFVREKLKILTETETRYLLDNNGHPDKTISDHLPIIFEIVEEESINE